MMAELVKDSKGHFVNRKRGRPSKAERQAVAREILDRVEVARLQMTTSPESSAAAEEEALFTEFPELPEAEVDRIYDEIESDLPIAAPSPVPAALDAATVLALMKQMGEDNRETMLAAIQELKRPSADQQAKDDADRARSLDLTMRRIAEARAQEADLTAAQLTCSHTRPDGKTRLRAQVLSNGYSQAFCPECHVTSAPFACAPHELTGGMNMDGWGARAWDIVQARVKNSPPPPPIPRLPPGARIQF
jgi:hypothetical protein